MSNHFWLGMAVIISGGAFNGSFALPMKFSRHWRWGNTWSIFAITALLILPCVLAMECVPHLGTLYQTAPDRLLFYPLLFGFLWGIAQVTFGLSINALGMAVATAVVQGIGAPLGSLIPLLTFEPAAVFRPRGLFLLASLPVVLVGLILYGVAGRRREREDRALAGPPDVLATEFIRGFAIAVFTGVFASSLNLGFAFGGDLIRRSTELGATSVTSTYSVWALVLGAGSIPNLLYCVFLLFRNRTWRLFREVGWAKEGMLSLMMALLWLGGILLYGVGATLMGSYGTSVGFVVMCALVLISANTTGILTGEWKSTSSSTKRLLAAGIAVMLLSVVVLNLGGFF
jgi:L-rhamnose-H+ transport protein